ncbi:MAG: hypothetical protein ABI389_09020 [Rhodanobacter sp.]
MINRDVTHFLITGNGDNQVMRVIPNTASVVTQFNWVQQLYDVTGTLDIELEWNDSAAQKATSKNALHTSAVYLPNLKVSLTETAAHTPLSAFDLVNTPANQNAAIQAMTKQGFWANPITAVKNALATFTSHFTLTQALYPIPVTIRTTLELANGSTCQIIWDVNTNRYDYVLGSGKDSKGNSIPENPDQAAGGAIGRENYIFSNSINGIDAATRAWQNFNDIGSPVSAPEFRSGSEWEVACVRTGGPSGPVTCTGIAL